MVRRLVIHIGAQKCASSSLQASLRLVVQKAKGGLGFCHLRPDLLRDVNQLLSRNDESAFDYIDACLSSRSDPQVVVSHEMLGNRPALVGCICIAGRALEKHSFDHVVISGYSRLQSGFQISEFSQWGFRGRAKLYADIEVLLSHDLNWRKFTALERSLLAFSLGGKDRDWFSDYQSFCEFPSRFGQAVSVVSSHIPTQSKPYSLLKHFLASTGLNVDLDDLSSCDVRQNLSFSPVLVHSVSNYLSSLRPRCESFFPGPHAGNQWIFRVARRLFEAEDVMPEFDSLFTPHLLHAFVGHLDCRSSSSNKRYCDLMNVDFDYFRPSQGSSLLSNNQLLTLARQTSQGRNLKQIEEIMCRLENLTMQAIRAEIESS